MTIVKLQHELGVTYKTAWRMYTALRKLMAQNDGDLLVKASDLDDEYSVKREKSWVQRWVFFNKLEIKVVEKEEKSS